MNNNTNKKHKNYTGTAATTARRAYEAKVSAEAMKRAGRNPQLKGHVHEIMFRDMQNANPENIMSGTRAVLSKSPTAVRDDVLLMNGGKVVGRYQLKDTPASIGKTVKQVSSGHYRGTNLVGTKETAAAYERMASKGAAVTQKMTSSGISSADTSRIAAETLGKRVSAASMQRAVRSSGATGALLSGGVEAFCAGKELMDGDIDTGEFVSRVATETVSGGASAAASMAAGSAAMTAVGAAVTGPIAVPLAIVVGLGTSVAAGNITHDVTKEVLNDAADGIRDAVVDTIDRANEALEDFSRDFDDVLDNAGYAISDAIDSLSDAVSDFGCFVSDLFDWF